MSDTRTHWDPVNGSVSVTPIDISKIRKGIAIPPVIKRGLLIGAIVSILWVLVAGFVSDAFPFVPVAVTTLVWALFFAADYLENAEGRKTIRRVQLAEKNGWSYTNKLIERVRKFVSANKSDGWDRETQLVKSERMLAIEAAVPELTKVRVGAFAGLYLDGEFWGTNQDNKRPFWLAVGSMQMEAGLAFNSALRRDNYGGKGGSGVFFSLLGAYKIERKTGVRAVVMPENIGLLDQDMKTESIAFNRAFNVSAEYKNSEDSDKDAYLEALRILTPATQDVMLTALKRYHNVGFVLDDDVLFFMAQDKLIGENAKQDSIDGLLIRILSDIEKTKFSLKNFVE